MLPENASSEGNTQTPSAPTTPSNGAAAFGESNAPDWVKAAGLEKEHTSGTPESDATPTAPVAPVVTPTALDPVAPAPTAPASPAPLTIDHAALARAIREGNQPAPAGPSDAELASQLGIVSVTPETYKQAFGVDGTPEQIKGLNDYGQGIAKQAVTIASILMQREIASLRESFAPYTEVIRTQERDRIKADFYKNHTDLTGYEAVVTQQYQLAMASGRKFPSIEAAGQFVAEQTRSHLTSLGIKPTARVATNGIQSPSKSAPQTRSMTPTSMGGKGGGTPAAAQPKSTGQLVWG